MKHLPTIAAVLTLLVAGAAFASHGSPWGVVNSAGPSLSSDSSKKRSAVRCYHMQWDTSGYDCGSYFCDQVAGPGSDSVGRQAINCVDLSPRQFNQNRRCDIYSSNGVSFYGRLFYSQDRTGADYTNISGAHTLECDYPSHTLMTPP